MRAAGAIRRRPFQWTALTVLIAVNAAVFFLQTLFAPAGSRADLFLQDWFALSTGNLASGKIWTLLTYSFLHQGTFHILGNMFVLWWSGRLLLNSNPNQGPAQSPRRFLIVYFGGVLLGAVTFALAMLLANGQATCIGASAGVFAVLTASLFQHYEEKLRFFLLFVIPLNVRGKIIIGVLAVVTLGGMFLSEIPATLAANEAERQFSERQFSLRDPVENMKLPPHVADSGVAHSAHLGGLLFSAALFLHARHRANTPVFLRRRRVLPFRQVIVFDRSASPPAPVRSAPSRPSPVPQNTPPAPSSRFPEPSSPPPLASPPTPLPIPPLPVPVTNAVPADNTIHFKVSHRWDAPPAMSEVNRILDKITASGFHSLTQTERDTLERASASLKK
jgi:membrane associated rhomboid family serine protease